MCKKKISFAMRFYHQILSICTKSHILLFAFNREEIPKKNRETNIMINYTAQPQYITVNDDMQFSTIYG